ncbi:Ficolin-1 [Holothuria leucospilota]|uniref:Ficolin-1 n=1 Tax=Holothuria leucospilota TaxID=206669 RepID=A0A9Q1BVB1_HOLLE|nr:Ficolin-1 [Holothuria leucospilota]
MHSHFLLVIRFVLFGWTSCILKAQQTGNQRTNVNGNQGSSYVFYQHPEYPKDCEDVFSQCSPDTLSGVYLVRPEGYLEPFEVFCDYSKSDVWTVVLRRNNGLLDFNRNWSEYKAGFGFLSQEFWLGNDKLSYLTNQKNYELRIDITNADGVSCNFAYSMFRTVDESGNYKIAKLGKYSGNFTDQCYSLCPSNMMPGDCSCQKTCANPNGCQNMCSADNICVCVEGLYLKSGMCVPLDECTIPMCIFDGVELKEGEIYINEDCTIQAKCNGGHLVINSTFLCNSNEVCEERNNVRQCYNSTISGCIVGGKVIMASEIYVNTVCTMRAVCDDGQLVMNGTYMCNSDEVCDKRNNVRQCYTANNDCQDIYNAGFIQSGVYKINPANWSGAPFEVFCNMTDGGGWTVFQRRIDGSVDFYRDWNTYKGGFGSPNHEYWLGNDKLHFLTNEKRQSLRIDLVNLDGIPYYVKFDAFRINNETDNYRLSEVGITSGSAGAFPLINHRTHQFTTYDQDNDVHYYLNCAVHYRGAWWYHACYDSNLNGPYRTNVCGCSNSNNNIWWRSLPEQKCNILVEMKIRPHRTLAMD